MSSFTLTSEAFADGETIPSRHTCDGEDVSPPLAWEGAPEGTETFVLVVHDPDAPRGDWVHWVLYDVPGHASRLPDGIEDEASLENLGCAIQGKNDFGRIGWGGPCPPPGRPHRYVFEISALDIRLELESGASREEVERAMEGHVLARAELTGTFGR